MKYLLILTLALSANTFAAKHHPANLIVKLKKNSKLNSIKSTMINDITPLVPEMGLYLVKKDKNSDLAKLKKNLKGNPNVRYVQHDHYVKLRAVTPNDPQFSDLWNLTEAEGVNAPGAWKFNVNGKNALNQDVVVAVVDAGLELTHSDLVENLWVNTGEIAGNGKDDDENGYVDDINGWNAYLQSGKITPDSHGTHVSGIVGARGNNSKQVCGVNWNTKIMFVLGAKSDSNNSLTSVALRAYGYVLKNKKLWLETNGAQGANIVSTNSSFGVDYADCNSGEYVAWNDIYDEMGKYGILSAAATANNNVNVDEVGDVPTGCASPFMVSVTNTTKAQEKSHSAGYGLTTIDLGAPGTGILSTYSGGGTANLTGTSMATPHVAGAIALLHAVAPESFSKLATSEPSKAALLLKEAILSTVTPLKTLESTTVSGGKLNAGAAANKLNQNF